MHLFFIKSILLNTFCLSPLSCFFFLLVLLLQLIQIKAYTLSTVHIQVCVCICWVEVANYPQKTIIIVLWMITTTSFSSTFPMIGLIHCDPQMTLYYEEHRHLLGVTAWGCEIMSHFIKRVMISQVGLITNSRLCAFISNAMTLDAVTSSLIWEGQMIDQTMVQWSIPGLELALNHTSRHPCGDFTRVRRERTISRLSYLFYFFW